MLIACLKARAGAINTLAIVSPRAARANGSLTGTSYELKHSALPDAFECCHFCSRVLPVETHHRTHLHNLFLTARGRIETVQDERAHHPSATVAALSPNDTRFARRARLSGASPRSREAEVQFAEHRDAQSR